MDKFKSYREWVATELHQQLAMDYRELEPMMVRRLGIVDKMYIKEWMTVDQPNQTTNDSCEHYFHRGTKTHYVMCYRGNGCNWYINNHEEFPLPR